VAEDGANEHHDEESQDDGEVGSEQAFALLHGSTASKEGDDDDQGSNDDHDVGGGRIEGDGGDDVIAGCVAFPAQALSVIKDPEKGGLGEEHPDPAAKDSHAKAKNEEVCDAQKILAQCSQTRIHLEIGFWT